MTPDTLNLRLQRGADFCMPLLLMDSGFRYIQISSINPASPLTITAPDHGMPSPEWPAWLEGTSSSQLNRDRLRQPFQLLRVLDDDTLEVNEINGANLKATGGQVVYHPPLDAAGWQFEAVFYAGETQLLSLQLGSGLTATAGGLELELTVEQIDQLATATRWELMTDNPAGRQRYLCGAVTVTECQHNDSCR